MAGKNEGKNATKSSKSQPKANKSKKSSKKSTSNRSALLMDGLPVSEMSREQLITHLTRLLDQLEKEREERNFFQLERDQIYGFWKVAKDEVEDTRARFRNKEKDLEDAEELRQKDIAVYKQQIKFLLHEHQSTLAEAQTEQMAALELARLGYQEQEQNFHHEHLILKEEIRQLELIHQSLIGRIKQEHALEMSDVRSSLEKEARQREVQFQNRIETQRAELEKRRKRDLQEIDGKDQQHITILRANHEQAIVDSKNYYNDIILNNMTLIASLKDQVNELRNKDERMEKLFHSTSKEMKGLQEKMEYLEKINREMEKESKNWQNAKSSLKLAKGHQKTLKNQLEEAVWQREILKQKVAQAKLERDELEEKFMAVILEVQQKANLKQLLLEKKLKNLQETVAVKDNQLNKLTPSSSQSITGDETTSSRDRKVEEKRVQTIVKMNFESSADSQTVTAGLRFSSVDNSGPEERLSVINSYRQSHLESIASSSNLSSTMNSYPQVCPGAEALEGFSIKLQEK